MNTFDRHRQYLLRRQRTRRLRRRAGAVTCLCLVAVGVWSFSARLGPPSVAPPPPAEVGARVLRQAVHAAAVSVNHVQAGLLPGRRNEAKQAARRLLAPSGVPRAVATGADNATAEPAAALDILLIGVDSRLGRSRGRADALHLLTIDVTTPSVRITGIPRGTPSFLGYADASSDILSNVLPARGREELRRRVARLCGRDSVPYFVQIGFSDAIGALELLGYERPGVTLQALRQRQGYQYGDHDRSYNQGLFIRQALLRMLPLLEGATGEALLRAGLELLETNLPVELCRGIVYLLNDADIGRRPGSVEVVLHSRFREHIEGRLPPAAIGSDASDGAVGAGGKDAGKAEHRIRAALAEAHRLHARPERVRALLWTMFEQHAWLQLGRDADRRPLRDSLAAFLLEACTRLGDESGAARIRRIVRADNELFPVESRTAFPAGISSR